LYIVLKQEPPAAENIVGDVIFPVDLSDVEVEHTTIFNRHFF
jgi:hypothetical protein